jgi:hypothetical protein
VTTLAEGAIPFDDVMPLSLPLPIVSLLAVTGTIAGNNGNDGDGDNPRRGNRDFQAPAIY